ncbi:hypothetical protein N7490_011086 [Penicillium lividum]|nr:hypothetical protein N7490_011086 [Penicillium lividum]
MYVVARNLQSFEDHIPWDTRSLESPVCFATTVLDKIADLSILVSIQEETKASQELLDDAIRICDSDEEFVYFREKAENQCFESSKKNMNMVALFSCTICLNLPLMVLQGLPLIRVQGSDPRLPDSWIG